MSGPASVPVLVVSADGGRRSRAVQALGETFEVRLAADQATALDELSQRPPVVAIIDAQLPGESLADLLSALGEPGRAVLWVSELRPEPLRLGVRLQVPYAAGETVLRDAVEHVADLQSLKAEASRQRSEVGRVERLLEQVRHVRHEINSPLTAIMAEAELLLTDAEGLNEEQRKGLQAIYDMAHRIRDLLAGLRELGGA